MADLTDARRAELLAYCKLTELADDPEVKLLIPVFYADAVSYMEDAGISVPAEGTGRRAKYDLCVNFMVLDSWENRDTKEPASFEENRSFRRRINQLKLTDTAPDVSDSDTSA